MQTIVRLSVAYLVVTLFVGETLARNPGRGSGQGSSNGSFNRSANGFGASSVPMENTARTQSFNPTRGQQQFDRGKEIKTWPNGDTVRSMPEQHQQLIRQHTSSRDQQAQRVNQVYGGMQGKRPAEAVERSAPNGYRYTHQQRNESLQQHRGQYRQQNGAETMPRNQYRQLEQNRYRAADSNTISMKQAPPSESQPAGLAKNASRQFEHRQAQAEHLRQIAEKNGNTNLTDAANRMQQRAEQHYEHRNQRLNQQPGPQDSAPAPVQPSTDGQPLDSDSPAGPGMAKKPSMFERMRNFFAPK